MRPTYTALFVPGSRPERFSKAIATGATRVIVDFEDAVEASLKAQARDNFANYLSNADAPNLMLRINAEDTVFYADDLRFCREHPQLKAVVVPKAESPSQLEAFTNAGFKVWPLIESARGLLACSNIAAAAGVECLTFGALDLAQSLGVNSDESEINLIFDQVRYSLLVNSAANKLMPPMDTIYPNLESTEGLISFAQHGKAMGMGGMLCIHPNQISFVKKVYLPQESEVIWAQRLIDAAISHPGAFRFEGKMVDAPVLERARQLLDRVPSVCE